MRVDCPHCGSSNEWKGNPFRPFCSERCRLLDLGSWATGDYAIPASEDNPSDEPNAGDGSDGDFEGKEKPK